MSNNYNEKSRADRIRWIVTVIALALVAILSIGLLCALFIRPQAEEEEAVPKDGAIISETAENGISLMSAKIMPMAYAANGVSALADTAYTLTATVEPDYEGDTTYYKDLSGEELAERYLLADKDTVLWRVAASVEGKYSTYTRKDSYLMYSWPAAGNYAKLNLSDSNLIF